MLMRRYIPLFIICTIFILLKLLFSFGVRISDTDIYFYTAFKLLSGKVLYKDIFFTNFPLFPYISAIYLFIFDKNILLYFASPLIEACLVSLVIYKIVLDKTNNIFLSSISIILYLFSFIVLSTSDDQNGIFLASFFAVLGYFLFLKQKPIFSGIFLALTLLLKAYFLPIFAATILLYILKSKKELLLFCLGFFITIFIILLPVVILSKNSFFNDVFIYSLTRSQGISKFDILRFFVVHDFLLTVIFIYSLFFIKKLNFFSFLSVFSLLFILIYQDLYYLYLIFIVPFLCIFSETLITTLQNRFKLDKLVISFILFLFIGGGMYVYLTGYRNLERVNNLNDIKNMVLKLKPNRIYGTNDMAPLVSYISGVPLLDNIIDTNANIFRHGLLNKTTLTKEAISQKSLFLAHGIYYPYQNINIAITDDIFDQKLMKNKNCKVKASYPAQTENIENMINLITCY